MYIVSAKMNIKRIRQLANQWEKHQALQEKGSGWLQLCCAIKCPRRRRKKKGCSQLSHLGQHTTSWESVTVVVVVGWLEKQSVEWRPLGAPCAATRWIDQGVAICTPGSSTSNLSSNTVNLFLIGMPSLTLTSWIYCSASTLVLKLFEQ